MAVYVDTSALVKRYVLEPTSPAFDAFVAAADKDLFISPLTITEFEAVLHRRLRQRDFDKPFMQRAQTLFSQDIAASLWQVQAFEPAAFQDAVRLIREVGVPLATLDALHLGSALHYGCTHIATSDTQLARAAQRSGLVIHDFSS